MKAFLLSAAVFLSLNLAGLAAPSYETDLGAALKTAATDGKMLFVLYGREKCGNCQATKEMIKAGQIHLSPSNYVLADLNCDDPAVSRLFNQHWGGTKFGSTLPFVVIADSHGKALGSSGGYKNAAEWAQIISKAKVKTASVPKPSAWPFKGPAATGTQR